MYETIIHGLLIRSVTNVSLDPDLHIQRLAALRSFGLSGGINSGAGAGRSSF